MCFKQVYVFLHVKDKKTEGVNALFVFWQIH